MKSLIISLALITASLAQAGQEFSINGHKATKLEAVKALMANPGAKVEKLCPVELTEKLTLKCKKSEIAGR